MAGNILHGSQTSIQLNDCKSSTNLPSIFDFLAQDSLRASLRPGIRAAVKLLAQKFPKLGSIVDRQFDEFFLLFEAMLENHFLKKFSASFAENFYALKRVPLNAGASMKLFRHRMRSLLALVIVPYIANKLEKLHQRLMDTPATGNSQQQSSPMRRLFLRFFPHLKALILLALFLFQAGYTFSLLPVPSPLLLLAKCRLERFSAEDLRQMEGADGPLHLRRGSLLSSLWRIFLWLPSAAGRLLSYGLFLLQILEYCYTDSLGKHFAELVSGQRIKIPEYPFQTLPSEQQVLCMEVDKCPLCKKTRQQDTVLSVSGYVFCHSCIYNFLLLEARCPVTSLPATTNELVKIYHS